MRAIHSILLLVTLYQTTIPALSYRILMSVPVASKSLHNLFGAVALSLTNANHDVTLMSSFDASVHHEKLTNINVMGGKPLPVDNIFDARSSLSAAKMLTNNGLYIGEVMWNNPAIKKIWEDRNKYDAVIIPSYINEINMPFLLNYTGSFFLICTPGVEYFAMGASSNWLTPSVVPHILLPFDEFMSFFERCLNVLTLILTNPIVHLTHFAQHDSMLRKYFPDLNRTVSYYDNVELTLINGHPALDSPLPLLPNQVEIGTINAQPPKPLPLDLEEFVSSSGDAGVIYFSIGSVAVSADIPIRAKLEFVEAFKRLPQKVVWKYEGTDLELPPNVIARKWLPQQDMLGHNKTRLFISHCGNLGTQEAKYHGVPVLAVPVAFDQPRNAARMVRKGLALSLEWDTLTAAEIVAAVNTLINDTSYKTRMQQISAILKDQKESPAERAVWWVEHVLKYRGAPHLKYPGLQLHFLQYICLDVFLFFALIVYVFRKLCILLLNTCTGLLFGKSKKTKKTKKH